MPIARACQHACVFGLKLGLTTCICSSIISTVLFYSSILLATCNDFLWLNGFVFKSNYRDIIDYRDNLATISQNIVIMFFWLSHRPTKKATEWALQMFHSWQVVRNDAGSNYQCPEDILLTEDAVALSKYICYFCWKYERPMGNHTPLVPSCRH